MKDGQEARISSMAPPEYEAIDDPHYEALARTGFFGEQAAGTVTVAADTGRMLLNLRSAKVEQPGTYGNAGGAHLKEEDPEAAALREHGEETGWRGEILAMIPAFVFRKGDFVYRNFVTVVPHEYEPDLGWEADSAVWCTTADLPSPLHFGIEALLADPDSRAILEGGWRARVGDLPYREAPAVFPREGEDGGSAFPTCRPLSPETLERVVAGVRRWIGEAGPEAGAVQDGDPLSGSPSWQFDVVLSGAGFPDDATLDRIHDAGCDDAVVSMQNGEVSICFERAAPDLETAVTGALSDVAAAGQECARVEAPGLSDPIDLSSADRA